MATAASSADGAAARAAWMALLCRAPVNLLEHALGTHAHQVPLWLRRPETGLMMVQARAGGTGERFNCGEVTVTRCALRLQAGGAVGVSYAMGRSHRLAHLAAVADALLQEPQHREALVHSLLQPLRERAERLRAERLQRVQSTRVEFFTVAREAGDGEDDDDEDGGNGTGNTNTSHNPAGAQA